MGVSIVGFKAFEYIRAVHGLYYSICWNMKNITDDGVENYHVPLLLRIVGIDTLHLGLIEGN